MIELTILGIVLSFASISLVFGIVIILSIISFTLVGVPFVPTPQKQVEQIINLLEIKPGQIFYDIGCGDGRFLFAAEKSGAKVIGFEMSLYAYLKAKANAWINKSQAKIYFKNFYRQSVADADIVVCFLLDKVMLKVEKKLLRELKSGSKVVSYGFALPKWQADKIISSDSSNPKASKIYFYYKK